MGQCLRAHLLAAAAASYGISLLAYVGPIGAFGVCLDIEHSSTNFDIGVWGLTDEDVRAKAAYSLGVTIQVDHDLVSDLLHSGELSLTFNLDVSSLLDMLSTNALVMGMAHGMCFSLGSHVDLPLPRSLELGGINLGAPSHWVGFMKEKFDVLSSCMQRTISSHKDEADALTRVEIIWMLGQTSFGQNLFSDDWRMLKIVVPFEFATLQHNCWFVSSICILNMP